MATLSDFGYEQYSERQSLLSKLVCQILDIQPGDYGYGTALDFCLGSLAHHRFADPNPREVDENYARLHHRLAQHAQLAKSEVLQELQKQCLALPLNDAVDDVHHRLLLALYSLAENPLASECPELPSGGLVPPQEEGTPGYETGSEGSLASMEMHMYSEGSDLSDWESEHEDSPHSPAGKPSRAIKHLAMPSRSAASPAEGFATSPLALALLDADLLECENPPVLSMPAALLAETLPGRLSTSLANNPHLKLPDRPQWMDEGSVVLQALRVLRGSRNPGPAFVQAGPKRELGPSRAVCIPQLSVSALHAILKRYSAAGNTFMRVQDFADKTIAAATLQPYPNGAPHSTATAFAAALRSELGDVGQAIIGVESQFRHESAQGNPPTLVHLEEAVQGVLRRLELLGSLTQSIKQLLSNSHLAPAESASRLLNTLYDCLEQHGGQGGPQGDEEAVVLFRLLILTAKPLFHTLHAWLAYGRLDDPTGAFFVQQGAAHGAADVESPDFWTAAFTLRYSADGNIACPSFLQPLASDILAAGKSQVLLRERPREELRTVYAPLETPVVHRHAPRTHVTIPGTTPGSTEGNELEGTRQPLYHRFLTNLYDFLGATPSSATLAAPSATSACPRATSAGPSATSADLTARSAGQGATSAGSTAMSAGPSATSAGPTMAQRMAAAGCAGLPSLALTRRSTCTTPHARGFTPDPGSMPRVGLPPDEGMQRVGCPPDEWPLADRSSQGPARAPIFLPGVGLRRGDAPDLVPEALKGGDDAERNMLEGFGLPQVLGEPCRAPPRGDAAGGADGGGIERGSWAAAGRTQEGAAIEASGEGGMGSGSWVTAGKTQEAAAAGSGWRAEAAVLALTTPTRQEPCLPAADPTDRSPDVRLSKPVPKLAMHHQVGNVPSYLGTPKRPGNPLPNLATPKQTARLLAGWATPGRVTNAALPTPGRVTHAAGLRHMGPSSHFPERLAQAAATPCTGNLEGDGDGSGVQKNWERDLEGKGDDVGVERGKGSRGSGGNDNDGDGQMEVKLGEEDSDEQRHEKENRAVSDEKDQRGPSGEEKENRAPSGDVGLGMRGKDKREIDDAQNNQQAGVEGEGQGGERSYSACEWWRGPLAAMSSTPGVAMSSGPGLAMTSAPGVAACGRSAKEGSPDSWSLARRDEHAAVSVAAFSGYAARQVWQRGSGFGEEQREDQTLDWLLRLQRCDLPPVPVIIRRCLTGLIRTEVASVGCRLLRQLLGEWGLRRELAALRNTFLLACPALIPFTTQLLGRLHAGDSLADLTPWDLHTMLQGTLPPSTSDQPLPDADALTLEVDMAAAAALPIVTEGQRSIAEVLPLRLRCRVCWPLPMILDDTVLEQYNQILLFLLQVRWVRYALEQVRSYGVPQRGAQHRRRDALLQEMTHFVSHLHSFVMDRLLHTAWPALEQAVESARSLDEVTEAHSSFMAAALRQCLCAHDRTWQLIADAVRRILDLGLRFAAVAPRLSSPEPQEAQAAEADLDALAADFRERHRYLLRVLTARTLKIGGYSALHHLVMRLNFNAFYPEALP